MKAANLFEHEKEILIEAKSLMGSLPFEEIDVFLCHEMGKNCSGTGMDTNIIGRSVYGYQHGTAWVPGMPAIWRIVVNQLSQESEGNAVGMGLADFVTDKFQQQVNYRYTTLNAMTGRAPGAAKTPIVLANTRDAVLAAIGTAPERAGGCIMVYARDTLSLETLLVSEAAAALLKNRENVDILGLAADLVFDADGYIESPFS